MKAQLPMAQNEIQKTFSDIQVMGHIQGHNVKHSDMITTSKLGR